MWFFGKKANQQSATPAAPGVPPELQQYYAQPTVGSHLRQASLFVLPVLALVVVLAGVFGGAVWLRNHSLSDVSHLFSRQTARSSSSSKANPQTTQPSVASSAQNQTTPTPVTAQSTPNSSQVAPNSTSSPQPSSAAAQTPVASSPSETTPIPSTGPGNATFGLAVIMCIVGTITFHVQQARRMRSVNTQHPE